MFKSHGNFTGLAELYSSYRPGYSTKVLDALLGLLKKEASDVRAADVGAGTGIWTRMIAERGLASVTAVEPNDDMRQQGEKDSQGTIINWLKGNGEQTGLADQSCDLVSMASSFHWVDFEKGCREFCRVLKKDGWFVALWNPRQVSRSPLLQEIEDYLLVLKPDLKRVSSGASGLTDHLKEKLRDVGLFKETMYMEIPHSIHITPEHYIGAWRSVNDVQVQLGPEKFEEFIKFASEKMQGKKEIEVHYLTRAWAAQKKDCGKLY